MYANTRRRMQLPEVSVAPFFNNLFKQKDKYFLDVFKSVFDRMSYIVRLSRRKRDFSKGVIAGAGGRVIFRQGSIFWITGRLLTRLHCSLGGAGGCDLQVDILTARLRDKYHVKERERNFSHSVHFSVLWTIVLREIKLAVRMYVWRLIHMCIFTINWLFLSPRRMSEWIPLKSTV